MLLTQDKSWVWHKARASWNSRLCLHQNYWPTVFVWEQTFSKSVFVTFEEDGIRIEFDFHWNNNLPFRLHSKTRLPFRLYSFIIHILFKFIFHFKILHISLKNMTCMTRDLYIRIENFWHSWQIDIVQARWKKTVLVPKVLICLEVVTRIVNFCFLLY